MSFGLLPDKAGDADVVSRLLLLWLIGFIDIDASTLMASF